MHQTASKVNSIRLLTGLLPLFLLGCATPSVVLTPELPPAILLAPCPDPGSGELATNGDLAEYVLRLKEALGLCNADKKAIKDWAEEIQSAPD